MHKALSVIYFILFLIFLSPVALCMFNVMDISYWKGAVSLSISGFFLMFSNDEQRVVNAKMITDDIERRMREKK